MIYFILPVNQTQQKMKCLRSVDTAWTTADFTRRAANSSKSGNMTQALRLQLNGKDISRTTNSLGIFLVLLDK